MKRALYPLPNTNWTWITWPDDDPDIPGARIISRAILTSLVPKFMKTVYKDVPNACDPQNFSDLTEMFFDRPGMIIGNRPTMVFELDGLKLTIPCQDVGVFAEILEKPYKTMRGRNWTQIAGFHRILVVTHDQARELRLALTAKTKEADRLDKEHFEAWKAGVEQKNRDESRSAHKPEFVHPSFVKPEDIQ